MIEFAITWLLVLRLGGQPELIPANGACAITTVSGDSAEFACAIGIADGSKYTVEGKLKRVVSSPQPVPETY